MINHDPKHWAALLIRWIELLIIAVIITGIILSAVYGLEDVSAMDWGEASTFYAFIDRLLLIVIGIEFVRMLIVRSLVAVLELLAFVVARKMLKPDMEAVEMAIDAGTFVLLVAARYVIEHYHRKNELKLPEMKH